VSNPGDKKERRTGGALRVPFVRRCTVDFPGGVTATAFIVNINVLGAYIAQDEMPGLGQQVTCRFQMPESELEVVVQGVVAWTNPSQPHPVHSLPPGFGVGFRALSDENRARIERIVEDYVARHGRG
jgi:Tfp pilus assembly protein PilZ